MSEILYTKCHLLYESHSVSYHPTQVNTVNTPRLTPAKQAGTRFTYPGGTEGWVDPWYDRG